MLSRAISRALVLASLLCPLAGCSRNYPVPTLIELPPLEPDDVMAFEGELFVPTGQGVQHLVGDELVDELAGLPPALESLHDTGEHLWLTRRDVALGWGSPETIYERRDDAWVELPLEGLLVSSAVTRGDDAWIVSVEGLGSESERRLVLFWHEGRLDEVTVPGDLLRLYAASDGIYLAAHTYRAGSELFVWSEGRFVTVPSPHAWSDDPLLMLVHGRLHAVDDHRLVDVLSGAAVPPAPPLETDDPWNAGLYYSGNERVVLIQSWSVFTGSYYSGGGTRIDAQIDRLEADNWVPAAFLEWSPQSAFWLADETLVVCDSTACFRAVSDTE